ncbi:hypothetical protein, partial [Mesorhizobium sp.]|uniref:hypothetical protein n=1 Tax=Mesorhizobium sp. TaxID=1871066 RepID=UPI00260146F2
AGRKPLGRASTLVQDFRVPRLAICRMTPHHEEVFNKSKGGDPMSSDFVFQNVASADRTFGKQSSR